MAHINNIAFAWFDSNSCGFHHRCCSETRFDQISNIERGRPAPEQHTAVILKLNIIRWLSTRVSK